MRKPKPLAIKYLNPDDLIPYARNARTHSKAQIAQVAASIVEFGWTTPILIDGKRSIIAGHARVQAAQKLNMALVPTIELKHLTTAQQRAYILADNKLALNAGWDEDMVAVELQTFALEGYELKVLGFTGAEVDGYLARAERIVGLTDDDAIPEPAGGETVTMPGDIWHLGEHRLMCGDATAPGEVEQLLGADKPGLMVTDQPWGAEYDPGWRKGISVAESQFNRSIGKVSNDDRVDWREVWSLFPGDVMYIWHGDMGGPMVASGIRAKGFAIRSQIVWEKPQGVFSRGHYHQQHEPCWYAVRQGRKAKWAGGRKQTTVWKFAQANLGQPAEGQLENASTDHGTQKPVEAMRRPMENNSSKGDHVYDPFMGSGTSIIAAETTGRICLGMEIEPIYCDMAVRRWQEFTGKQARLGNAGRDDLFPARLKAGTKVAG